MICIAKGIASGLPLGVCSRAPKSWTGSPAPTPAPSAATLSAIAAALATIDILEREGIENAAPSANRCSTAYDLARQTLPSSAKSADAAS